jgi:hypothetical protein
MVYITAVRFAGSKTHANISHVRWLNPADGKAETSTKATMVDWLQKNKNNAAKVAGEDGPATVGVVKGTPPYLRTHADGEWNNNLLSLPAI